MDENRKKRITKQVEVADWSLAQQAYLDKKLYLLDDDLDIADVALALHDDYHSQVDIWLQNGLMYPPTTKEAKIFESHKDMKFKYIFVTPYLIMQRTYPK